MAVGLQFLASIALRLAPVRHSSLVPSPCIRYVMKSCWYHMSSRQLAAPLQSLARHATLAVCKQLADHSPPTSAEVKKGGAIPPLPHMSSWDSA
jgi:hypothetical protein